MGRKSNWKSGETTAIRVPAAFADRLLELARQMDEGETPDFVQNRTTGETLPPYRVTIEETPYQLKGGYFDGDTLDQCDRLCDALFERCEAVGIDPRLVYMRLVETWLDPIEKSA